MPLSAPVRAAHGEIAAAAEALQTAVTHRPLPASYSSLRMRLAVALRSSQALYQSACLALTPDQRRAISRFTDIAAADQQLRVAYSRHIAQWTAAAVADDVDAYADKVKHILGRLHAHLRVLETDFYEPMGTMLGAAHPLAARAR